MRLSLPRASSLLVTFAALGSAACTPPQAAPHEGEGSKAAGPSSDAGSRLDQPGPDGRTRGEKQPEPQADAVATPPPTRDVIDCPNLVDHQIALHAASKAPLKGPLPARDEMIATCESKTLDVDAATCVAKAIDDAGVQACSREALGKIVDVKVGRRLDFAAAHAKLDPPLYSLDGDFVLIGEHCGVLYREHYPAGGTFVACDDRLVIGPMVAPMEGLTAYELLSAKLTTAKDVLDAFTPSWTSKTGYPLRVHLYDERGQHVGVEER